MKRVVCLGSSLAGLTAIEKIKEKSNDYDCTILSLDGSFPAYRERYPQLIGKNIKIDDLCIKEKNFFENNKINMVLDKKINRVNFNRKIIFTEDKEEINFDILLICDFPTAKWPDIKGTNKNGVYSLNKSKNILECYEILPIIDAVVIESQRPDGFLLALAYLQGKKVVSLITKKEWLLPSYFSKEVSDALVSALEDQGLKIYTSNEISEILGEGDAKAVRLKSNKVLAADATFLADVLPDPKLINSSNLARGERISVDQNNKTNLENVFALDLACLRPGSSQGQFKSAGELVQEGERVAAQILGEEISLEAQLSKKELVTEALSIAIYGESSLGSESKEVFDPAGLCYKRLIYRKGEPIGAVLINAEDKKEIFEKFLKKEIDWAQIEPEFSTAAVATDAVATDAVE